jgi:hypothetical protein
MTLGDLVDTPSSVLGGRLSFVGLLPTTLLVLFVLALTWLGAPATAPNVQTALAEIGRYGTCDSLLLVIAIAGLTIILQPFQLFLVRTLEGYWGTSTFSKFIGAAFVNRHCKKRDQLKKALDAILQSADPGSVAHNMLLAAKAAQISDRLERFYPKHGLLPTTLGNILRAAEQNSGSPYSLDIITAWPRLYAILPERTAALVDDQRNQLDIAVRFCATFAVATVVSAGFLVQHGWWLTVPMATLALAWISYRGAIASALAYGTGIRMAVDLHRFDLLRALHLPLPEDRETEKQTNTLLSEFLRQGRPVNFRYDHTPEK